MKFSSLRLAVVVAVSFSLFMTLVTSSLTVNDTVSDVPEQVHVVMGGVQPGQLHSFDYVVQFVTFGNSTDVPDSVVSTVQYGLSPSSLTLTQTSKPFVFIDNATCPQFRLMHAVTMPNLQQGVYYYYRVSAGPSSPWSKVYNFKTIDHSSKQIVLSTFGDMGSHYDITAVPRLIEDTQNKVHDFVLHFGDIAYNLEYNCSTVGDQFMRDIEPVAANVPYVFGVGNHESESESESLEIKYKYRNFLARYKGQLPIGASSGSNSTRYFSFNVQRIHIAMIDTDAWVYPEVWDLAEPQFKWLEKDLAAVNRTATPWLVVFGHRAMYCTKSADPECNGEAESIRYGILGGLWGIEQLLIKYGADIYLAGHTHHYMRTFPVAKGQLLQTNYVNPKGCVHVQSGIGGVDGQDEFTVPPREYDAFLDYTYARSWTRMTFFNDTHLQVQQFNASDRSLIDTFTIVQNHHGPFQQQIIY